MNSGRILIVTGVLGGVVAAICCATPLLAIVLGAAGLTAWLAKADYVVIPVFLISGGLVGFGIYRRRTADAASGPSTSQSSITS